MSQTCLENVGPTCWTHLPQCVQHVGPTLTKCNDIVMTSLIACSCVAFQTFFTCDHGGQTNFLKL